MVPREKQSHTKAILGLNFSTYLPFFSENTHSINNTDILTSSKILRINFWCNVLQVYHSSTTNSNCN
jgi:hypothetical protein